MQTLTVVARIIVRYRSNRLHRLPWTNDVVIFVTSLCALGSTVVTSTAVTSGLGKIRCLLSDSEVEQIQLRLYVTTILFILVVSISKSSVLLFLYHLAETALQRAIFIAISTLVVLWTIVVLAGMIFQCELPTPWRIWTDKCIPLVGRSIVLVPWKCLTVAQVPFWMTMNIADIALEAAIIALFTYSIWRLRESYRQKTLATLLLSLRLM
jgi:hypothetical protein